MKEAKLRLLRGRHHAFDGKTYDVGQIFPIRAETDERLAEAISRHVRIGRAEVVSRPTNTAPKTEAVVAEEPLREKPPRKSAADLALSE